MKYDQLRFCLESLGLVQVPLPSDETFDIIFSPVSEESSMADHTWQSYKFLGEAILNKIVTQLVFNALHPSDEKTLHDIRGSLIGRSSAVIVKIAKDKLELEQYILNEMSVKQYTDIVKTLIGVLTKELSLFDDNYINDFVSKLWEPHLEEKLIKLKEEAENEGKVEKIETSKMNQSGCEGSNLTSKSSSSSSSSRNTNWDWGTIQEKFISSVDIKKSQRLLFFLLKSTKREVTVQELDSLLERMDKDKLLTLFSRPIVDKVGKFPPRIIYGKINSAKLALFLEKVAKTESDLLLNNNNFISVFEQNCKVIADTKKLAEAQQKFADQNAPISSDQKRLLLFLAKPEAQLSIQQFIQILDKANCDRLQKLWETPFVPTGGNKKLPLFEHILQLQGELSEEKLLELQSRLESDLPVLPKCQANTVASSSSDPNSISQVKQKTPQGQSKSNLSKPGSLPPFTLSDKERRFFEYRYPNQKLPGVQTSSTQELVIPKAKLANDNIPSSNTSKGKSEQKEPDNLSLKFKQESPTSLVSTSHSFATSDNISPRENQLKDLSNESCASSSLSVTTTYSTFSKVERKFINSQSPISSDQARLIAFLKAPEEKLSLEKFNSIINKISNNRLCKLLNEPLESSRKKLLDIKKSNQFNLEKLRILESQIAKNEEISLEEDMPYSEMTVNSSSVKVEPNSPLNRSPFSSSLLLKQPVGRKSAKKKKSIQRNTQNNTLPSFQSWIEDDPTEAYTAHLFLEDEFRDEFDFLEQESAFVSCKSSMFCDQQRLAYFLEISDDVLPVEKFDVLIRAIGKSRLSNLWRLVVFNKSPAPLSWEEQAQEDAEQKELDLVLTNTNFSASKLDTLLRYIEQDDQSRLCSTANTDNLGSVETKQPAQCNDTDTQQFQPESSSSAIINTTTQSPKLYSTTTNDSESAFSNVGKTTLLNSKKKSTVLTKEQKKFIANEGSFTSQQTMLLSFMNKTQKKLPLVTLYEILGEVSPERLHKLWYTPLAGVGISPAQMDQKKRKPKKVACLEHYLNRSRSISPPRVHHCDSSDLNQPEEKHKNEKNWDNIKSEFINSQFEIPTRQIHLLSLLNSTEDDVSVNEFQALLIQVDNHTLTKLWESPNQEIGSSPSKIKFKQASKDKLTLVEDTLFLNQYIQSMSSQPSSAKPELPSPERFNFTDIEQEFIHGNGFIHIDQSHLYSFLTSTEVVLPSNKFEEILNRVPIHRLHILWEGACPPGTKAKSMSHESVKHKFNPEKLALFEKRLENNLDTDNYLHQGSATKAPFRMFAEQPSVLQSSQVEVPPLSNEGNTNSQDNLGSINHGAM